MSKEIYKKATITGGGTITVTSAETNGKPFYLSRISGSVDADALFSASDAAGRDFARGNLAAGSFLNATFNNNSKEQDRTSAGSDFTAALSAGNGYLQVVGYYYP